jgi:hypothetical protein
MEWYVPLTIIPGVALIILSTSNIMLALNSEITTLVEDRAKNKKVINLKLLQLKRLSISIVLQYIGICFFLVSGITKSLFPDSGSLANMLLLAGVAIITVFILILLVYSIKAVTIRQMH